MSSLDAVSCPRAFAAEPAAAVIAELLRQQGDVPKRGTTARVFGRSPLAEDAVPWWRGVQGEKAVGRLLAALGDEFTILHAVPVGSRGSDLDHVVIGPPGVIVINTKHHDEKDVWIGTSGVRVSGQRTDHVRNSRHEARRVQKMLAARFDFAVPVRAIIAVHGARRLTVRQQPEGVTVLRSAELVRALRRAKGTLGTDQCALVAETLSRSEFWGAASDTGLDDQARSAFAALEREVQSAHNVRRTWAAGALMGVLAAAVALASPLLSAWGG